MNVNDLHTQVISGFPGVGKSIAATDWSDKGYRTIDLDSTPYSKGSIQCDVGAIDWIDLYVDDIRRYSLEYDFILVSSHTEVRMRMAERKINFWLVFPDKKCKAEYILRYMYRGDPDTFIELLKGRWEVFMDGCLQEQFGRQVVLSGDNMYLNGVLNRFVS